MKFMVIIAEDGGYGVEKIDWQDVCYFLAKHLEWQGALEIFRDGEWQPGMWMQFPNGHIFCVSNEV